MAKALAEQSAHKVTGAAKQAQVLCAGYVSLPLGAGLHVGHPLGYIASDILSRYKRHKGYNVLHPMGYDACFLPSSTLSKQDNTPK